MGVRIDTLIKSNYTLGKRPTNYLKLQYSTSMKVLAPIQDNIILSHESRGAVFTKTWVVDLILNLGGYSANKNLVDAVAIEPAAGEGAFLLTMIERLLESCHLQRRPVMDCVHSLIAYEIDESTASQLRAVVLTKLLLQQVNPKEAEYLTKSWVRVGDFLLDAKELPKADYVIGNPPYVRLENIPEIVADHYRSLYPTMKGRADIYIGFYEAALRQLKPNGVCVYICADRWMLNQYGAELRQLITDAFSVEAVIEMHNADAFEDEVSAYPAITVIRSAEQHKVVVASVASSTKITEASLRDGTWDAKGVSFSTIEDWFKGTEPWPCNSPKRLALLRRLEREFQPLESKETATKVSIGIATGLDDAFITTDKNVVEESRLLPLAMASDTLEGVLKWSEHYLVNPWNEAGLVELDEFPRLSSYIAKHAKEIKERHTAEKNPLGWYRTIDRVNFDLFRRRKIYIPDIKNTLNPVLDMGTTYPHHNLYVVFSETWDLEVLGGILLSKIGQFFIECYGVRMRGGYLRFQAQYLRRIRVPDPTAISKDQQKLLRKAFAKRDVGLATEIVMQLYHFTSEERDLILSL